MNPCLCWSVSSSLIFVTSLLLSILHKCPSHCSCISSRSSNIDLFLSRLCMSRLVFLSNLVTGLFLEYLVFITCTIFCSIFLILLTICFHVYHSSCDYACIQFYFGVLPELFIIYQHSGWRFYASCSFVVKRNSEIFEITHCFSKACYWFLYRLCLYKGWFFLYLIATWAISFAFLDIPISHSWPLLWSTCNDFWIYLQSPSILFPKSSQVLFLVITALFASPLSSLYFS